jgi:transcriptional regulator with XRE-family HTH domain
MLSKINKERKKMIIENIMKENKINLTEVSKQLGISKSYTSMLLSGDRKASINLLKKIKDKYKYSWNKIMENL